MTTISETDYRPTCLPKQAGTCAECDLAYDCQSKMSGRLVAWPIVALVVAAGMGLVAYLV